MDTKKAHDKIWDNILFSPGSIPVFIVVEAALALVTINPFLPKEENSFSLFQILIISLILLAAVMFGGLYCRITYKRNAVPRIKNGEIGVLVLIKAQTSKRFDDIKHIFKTEFNDHMRKYANFSVSYVPYELMEKFDVADNNAIVKMLRKANAIYMIEISVNTDDPENVNQYRIKINQGVIHSTYDDKTQQGLANEMGMLSKELVTKKFQKQEKIDVMMVTTKYLALVCQYIIGVTFYLNGGETEEQAIIIHDRLYEEVYANKHNDATIRELKRLLRQKCFAIHIRKADRHHFNCFFDKKDELASFCQELEKANSCIPNTYDYYMLKANYHVLCREYKKARECLNICKKMPGNNKIWLYSDAYLTAYESERFLTIYNKYERAFKIPYPLQQLINYIETVYEEEPQKKSLLFVLGLLYCQVEDIENAKTVFRLFYEHYLYSELSENVNTIIANKTGLDYSELMNVNESIIGIL